MAPDDDDDDDEDDDDDDEGALSLDEADEMDGGASLLDKVGWAGLSWFGGSVALASAAHIVDASLVCCMLCAGCWVTMH